MAVLLLAEVNNGELAMDATAKAVTAAKQLGDVVVLAAGGSAAAAGEAASKIDGVSKVLVAEDASLGHRLAESTAALIVSLAGDYDHVVAPSTTDAKNVMARVAGLLDVMIISDATAVIDADTFERPIYASNHRTPRRSSPSVHRHSMRLAKAAPLRSRRFPQPITPVCPSGSKTKLPKATAPS